MTRLPPNGLVGFEEIISKYAEETFSDGAIIQSGRELAKLTASDLAKFNLTDERLKEISEKALQLHRQAELALQIRNFIKLTAGE